MSLFPNLEPAFYTDDDQSVRQLMDWFYQKNATINLSFWGEADLDTRFEAGDQSLFNSLYGNYYPTTNKRDFYFNLVKRQVNMITGYQRQHRKSMTYVPVEGADQKTCDQFTKLALHCQNNDNMLLTISDAFHGAVTTGMSLLSLWLDYSKDPVNGDVRLTNLPYNAFMIDSFFKKQDLSDCNGLWGRRYISRSQAMALLPSHAKDIMDSPYWGGRDGRFQFMPENYNYSSKDLMVYDEFWYPDTRVAKFITDLQLGETKEWRGSKEDLAVFQEWAGPRVAVYDSIVPTVKLAVVLNGRVCYNGPNPMGGDSYPFVPVFGYYYPQIAYFPTRTQGVVRNLRDPQWLFNHKMKLQMQILEAQPASGFIFKENALVNPSDAFLSGPGRAIPLKEEAQMTDITPIPPPRLDASMMQLTQEIANLMPQISGVNEELMGSADDDKPGILSILRHGAGLTTLQPLFDNLDFAQKILGERLIEIVQNNYTPGKVARIIGEQPSEQFYNQTFQRYNCVVEEGLNTPTQRQMQAKQLFDLKQMGAPISWSLIIDSAPLQNKDDLLADIRKQEEQAQQMQQQQMGAQMELLKAQISDLQGKTTANKGLGIERISRVEENRALAIERIAEAKKDNAAKDLDYVKAVKELTTVDLDQLLKGVSLLQALRTPEPEQTQNNSLQSSEGEGYNAGQSPSGEMTQGAAPPTRTEE